MKYCAPLSKCIWLRMFTSTWPRRRQLSCNEKSYKQCTKRSPPYRNSYWFDNYSIWRWESHTQQPPTSTPLAWCCLNSPPKGLTLKKKLKLCPPFKFAGKLGGLLHDIRQQPSKSQCGRSNWTSPNRGHPATIDGSHHRWFGRSLPLDRDNKENRPKHKSAEEEGRSTMIKVKC